MVAYKKNASFEHRLSSVLSRLIVGFLFAFISIFPFDAFAHLSTFGSWETTEKHLNALFPEANTFLVKSDTYADEKVKEIEKTLGFKLFPEDLAPTFYIALKKEGKSKKFLGVAMFIDPRVENQSTARFDVGVAVNKAGKISRIRVFENRSSRALGSPSFLDQFEGLNLKSDFNLSSNKKVNLLSDFPVESQLVSNAAFEALYLMKISLSKKK